MNFHGICFLQRILPILYLSLQLAPIALASPSKPMEVMAMEPDLISLTQDVPVGGVLKIRGMPIAGEMGPAQPQRMTTAPQDLTLTRIRVFADDAVVLSGSDEPLPVPEMAWFAGEIEGVTGSKAILSFPKDEAPRGFIFLPQQGILQFHTDAQGLKAQAVPASFLSKRIPFHCGTENPSGSTESPKEYISLLEQIADFEASPITATASSPTYVARIAIDADYEFYKKFSSMSNAISYVGELVAYASLIYKSEINTQFEIGYLKIWDTSPDPWNGQDTLTALEEFADYWAVNNGGISRSIAHLLSGKGLGGGRAASLGGLCSKSIGYGVSEVYGSFSTQDPSAMGHLCFHP